LDSPVSIEFENIHLQEVLEFINNTWEVNMALDWRVVAPPPPRAKPTKPARTESTGIFGWFAKLFKSERKPVPAPALPAEEPEGDTASAPVANSRYVTDGLVPYINLRDVCLRDALVALLRPLNLTFTTYPHAVWVSSPAMIEADRGRPKPESHFKDENIMKILASPVGITFENIHLSEILEFISDSWEMNIVLDSRVIAQPRVSVTDVKLGSPGYVTNGIVQYINLANIPLEEALDILLRPLDLTYTVERGFVWVSSYDLVSGGFVEARPGPAEPTSAEPGTEQPENRGAANPAKSTTGPEEPSIRALRIRQVNGSYRAQLQTVNTTKWYSEGEEFESFKVMKINPQEQTVSVFSEKDNRTATLRVAEQ
jgi:hypothetical protein